MSVGVHYTLLVAQEKCRWSGGQKKLKNDFSVAAELPPQIFQLLMNCESCDNQAGFLGIAPAAKSCHAKQRCPRGVRARRKVFILIALL